MEKIFNKYELIFCMLLIILYILLNLFCIQVYGLIDYRSVIINSLFSIFLVILIILLKRVSYYGINKITNIRKYLYFFPLILILSVNFWNGFNINNSIGEFICYILTMINIGFIEEIIFRGFLFKMMEKDNLKVAIFVNAFTFGIGHIINLVNGSELIPTLFQVCYAFSIGYLFVIIFYKSKSLIPCIITHCLMNSFSIFNVDNSKIIYISSIFLIIVPLVYANYLNKKIE